jgi:hypothetical protein
VSAGFKVEKWESGLDNGRRPPARGSERRRGVIRTGRFSVVAGNV